MVKKSISILISVLLSVFLIAAPSWAINVSTGDKVELKASSSLGVPLHEFSSPSLIGRAPDGTVAEVVATIDNQHWINIKLPNGNDRWIVERYVSRVISSNAQEESREEEIEIPQITEPLPKDNQPTEATVGEGIFPELSGEALRSRLASDYKVKTTLGYDKARDYMYSELDNDNGLVRGIYSDFTVSVNPGSSTPRSDAYQNGKGINAEHSWPQSKGATGVAQSDLHHLFPTRVRVNTLRSSHPFAEIEDTQTRRWILDDDELPSIPVTNIDAYSESTGSAFEPREEVKGNIARALFYFYTVYRDQAEPGFFEGQQQTLCDWNISDPIDAAERRRSRAISTKQGNNNPFVIDSTLAERLYCSR